MERIKSFIFILSFYFANSACAQDSTAVDFNGYLKNLQTFSITDRTDTVLLSNLIHNRINFSYHPGNHFVFNSGLRNLLYIGDLVKYTPDFSKLISQDNGYYKLSVLWADQQSLVFVTLFDRLNASWNFKKGFVRAGRQRINWGINLIWNPNDIFNTYNFLDFDYEERPGIDAVQFSYNLKNQANLNLAISPSRNDSAWIGALKYGLNKWGYDFQFIGGIYKTDLVAGIGFAGNIGEAGWKGEISWFEPRKDFLNQGRDISVSSGIDYGFKSGWYLNGSFLYNSEAPDQLYSIGQLTSFQLSPKTLMPAKWNFLVQALKPFSPLMKGSFSLGYSPKLKLLILLPYLSYSLADNWDIDLNVQSFFAENSDGDFQTLGNSINLRLKWSY